MSNKRRFVDFSSFQPENINWSTYVAWARTEYDDAGNIVGHNGIPCASFRVSQGINTPDTVFAAHYKNAKAAGVEQFIFYHFCYPWLHPLWSGAQAEVKSFLSVLGDRLGPEDLIMLDAESFQGNSGPADWHWDWLYMAAHFLNIPYNRAPLYSNLDYIAHHLQDSRLAQFPLILADWTWNPTSRPAAPKPWSSYLALQWTDRGTVPGVPEAVDVNTYEIAPPAPPPPPEPDMTIIIGDVHAALTNLADAQSTLNDVLARLKG